MAPFVSNVFIIVCFLFIQKTLSIEFRTDADSFLTEGSVCKFNHNASMGTCTAAVKCSVASWEIQNLGISPTTCSFNGNQPIICCNNDAIEKRATVPEIGSKTQSTIQTTQTNYDSQRKSAYCKRYLI